MELKDTIGLMGSGNYQDRYKGEYYQLKIRAKGLKLMLAKYKAGTLAFTPTCSYELLYEQLVYMENYMRILEDRARIEEIEL